MFACAKASGSELKVRAEADGGKLAGDDQVASLA
jgi:hypothetical protein